MLTKNDYYLDQIEANLERVKVLSKPKYTELDAELDSAYNAENDNDFLNKLKFLNNTVNNALDSLRGNSNE